MKTYEFLVVDDDADMVDGLAEVLEIRGHKVDVAFTGEDGVKAAASRNYEAILLDIGLPGINGFDAFTEILKTRPESNIILMSGFNARFLAEQAAQAGATEILSKPLNMDALWQRIGKDIGGNKP